MALTLVLASKVADKNKNNNNDNFSYIGLCDCVFFKKVLYIYNNIHTHILVQGNICTYMDTHGT